MEDETLAKLKTVFEKHKGNTPVYLNVSTKKNGSYRIEIDKELFVNPTDAMIAELEEFVDRDHIKFEKSLN